MCWFFCCLLVYLPPGLKRLSPASHVLFIVTNLTLCFENRTWKTWWEKQAKLPLWTHTGLTKMKGEFLSRSCNYSNNCVPLCFGPNECFCFYTTEWLSLHPAVTWRMPSPSSTVQSWMDASLRSLRTAEGELLKTATCFVALVWHYLES